MAAPEQSAIGREEADAMLFREEIIDSRGRLCGYRFSMKSLDEQAFFSEQQLFEALQTAGIQTFAQRRVAVIPITPDGIVFGRHKSMSAENTVFLLDPRKSTLPLDRLLGCLSAIRGSGCKAALTGILSSDEELSLLAESDIVFLNIAEFSLQQFQKLAQRLRAVAPQVALGVEGIHSWAEQRMCAASGFEYFLGDFLATAEEEKKDQKIDQGRITAIEMLNLLRSEADLSELGEVAKKDPGIAFQLLKVANSPASGLNTQIATLDNAILVLGREQLYRWLTISMFRIGQVRERDEALLEIALTRARFLETLATPGVTKKDRDELFLVGMLSLFDVLLGMPMYKVMEKMQLSPSVLEVLLRSEGPHGKFLMLALAVEKGRTTQAAKLAEELGVALDTLEPTSQAAFTWAQDALGYGESR
ncbi:MAG: HDOD domain-containing protein [Sulfuricella sp.]